MDYPIGNCVRSVMFGFMFGMSLVAALPMQGNAATLGGNTTFERSWWFFGTYADQTAASEDATMNDTLLAHGVGEYSYWGLSSPFDAMYFSMATWGVDGNATFEYSSPVTSVNPDGFSGLTLTSNPSNDFNTPISGGLTSVAFTPPSNWIKSTVNGRSAYWVRIGSSVGYSTAPRATMVQARAYNLRLKVQNDRGTVYTANLNPTLTACGVNTNLGEWNAGAGIHNFALRTDGGDCTLQFVVAGYVTRSVTATGLTSVLKDLSGSPTILVRDELLNVVQPGGDALPTAAVTFYTDAARTAIADDLSQAGTRDARGFTDAFGQFKTALAEGTYYYKVTASGYADATGSVFINGGVSNSQSVTMRVESSDTSVSVSRSSVDVAPSTIVANAVQTGSVTVVIRNASNIGISGKTVTLASSLSGVIISPTTRVTDASGFASFTIRSGSIGATTLTAMVDGLTMNDRPTVQFVSSMGCPYIVGQLVKLPDDGNFRTQEDSAVYYYASDCRRHAFPNDKVYFTWYSNFFGVSIVSPAVLASMPLGKNVTYRPGVKLVKFTTVPKTYAVSRYGVLRWITSETLASQLYGSSWNTKVDDIDDAFYTNYAFAADVYATDQYHPQDERDAAPTINDNL